MLGHISRFARSTVVAAVTALLLGPLAVDPASATVGTDFAGTARFGGICSAAVIALDNAQPTDQALLLTAAHCLVPKQPGRRGVVLDRPMWRRVSVLARRGEVACRARATRVVYATMWRTDAALLRLNATYADLAAHDVSPLPLATASPRRGEPLTIPSALNRRALHCPLGGIAYRLHEQIWDWHRSLWFANSHGCRLVGGDSGAPVLDRAGRVVGVANTGWVGGRPCVETVCQEDRRGRRRGFPDRSYGQ